MPEAHTVLAQMVKVNASVASMDYLNARVQMRQGNWAEAARLLEAHPWTGHRHAGTGDPGRPAPFGMLQSTRRFGRPGECPGTSRLAGKWVGPRSRTALAAALPSNGRLDDALEQYRQLMALPEAPKSGWIKIARLRVSRATCNGCERSPNGTVPRRPKTDNKDTDLALDKAAAENPDAVDVPLLRADLLLARGKSDDARALLKETIGKHKDRAEPWMALAGLAALPEGGNDPAEATRILAEARKQLGDTVEMRLAQVRYSAQRGGTEAGPALDALRRGMEKFAAEQDQVRLLGELAESAVPHRQRQGGRTTLDPAGPVADQQKQSAFAPPVVRPGAASRRRDRLQSTLAELKRIEGEQGTLWRFAAASRLIYRGRRGKPEELDEARQLLDAVAARRPGWPNVLVARADLEEAAQIT